MQMNARCYQKVEYSKYASGRERGSKFTFRPKTAAAFTFEDSAIARLSRSADLETEARVWFLQIAVFDEARFGSA
jgi:hypothetical protein